MSYTRRYSETVSKTEYGSKTVSYPASQSGGSMTVTVPVTVTIPIDVNIHVDTLDFDSSVDHCGNNVDLLTASVVATETAAIASKRQNSRKVADSIISGFFSYVRSEISQQVSEITQQTESQLMHLKELAKACLAKKDQMETDYHRITSRYSKTFSDLNQELSNRIYELDRPVFTFKKETESERVRPFDGLLSTIVSVFGTESGALQARVAGSLAKKKANDTIAKAKTFIQQQQRLNETVKHAMIAEERSGKILAPACFVQLRTGRGQVAHNVYANQELTPLRSPVQQDALAQQMLSGGTDWHAMSASTEKTLNYFFNQELNKNTGNDARSARLKETIRAISKLNRIQVNY